MTPEALIQHCRDQQTLTKKPDAQVGFLIPGHMTGLRRKRLCPGGPLGEPVGEPREGFVMVFFDSREVIAYLERKLRPVILRREARRL
jgi:hypothetical protein